MKPSDPPTQYGPIRQACGFTLVELLVALVLGLMLSAGVVNVYLQNKRNYLQDEEIARVQENARYALNLLKRELIMAGFIAGIADYDDIGSGSVTADCVGTGNWALNVSDVFELIDNVNTGASLDTVNGTTWTCLTASELESGTDLVSIKRTADSPTLDNGALTVSGEDKRQWYLSTTDGDFSSWQYIDSGDTIPTGGAGVDYWEYYSKIFYIRNFSRTAGDGIPSLCIESLGANAFATECLVEGIEDMQIEVGIDTDNDSVPDQFVATPTATQIQDAVAVRVYLLVRSINEVSGYTNTKTYTLGSKAVGPQDDGFIRRVFSTTVQMRNAKLPNA